MSIGIDEALIRIAQEIASRSAPAAQIERSREPSGDATSATAAVSAAPAGGGLSLPIGYSSLLEAILMANLGGYATPETSRQVVALDAGTSASVVAEVTSGDVLAVVYLLRAEVDNYSPDFYLSLQVDQQPPFLNQSPMTEALSISGSFLTPARTQVLYTFDNQSILDITATITTQTVTLDSTFVRSVYRPLVDGQMKKIEDLAAFIRSQGGGR